MDLRLGLEKNLMHKGFKMAKRKGLQKYLCSALKDIEFSTLNGKTFTRQIDEQIHFVGLQYGGFSRGYTINLGCHFHNIPSLFDYSEVDIHDMDELDAGLRCRVGHYIDDGRKDVWWDPTQEDLPAAIAQAVSAIDRAFTDCLKNWGRDGLLILNNHILLHKDSVRFSKNFKKWMAGKGEFERLSFVAILASRHGNTAMAKRLFDIAISLGESIIYAHVPKLASVLGLQQS